MLVDNLPTKKNEDSIPWSKHKKALPTQLVTDALDEGQEQIAKEKKLNDSTSPLKNTAYDTFWRLGPVLLL